MFNLLCIRAAAIPRLTRLLQTTSLQTQDQINLSDQLEHEQTKSHRGKIENSLRQHNLLPVVFQLFKAMGESGQMGESPLCTHRVQSMDSMLTMVGKAVEDARTKGKARRERAKETGVEED